jgi:pyruvate dehydrogenase (quinone)
MAMLEPMRRNDNPMQLVMPPFVAVEPAIAMALYTTRAVLHGRAGDVWEMVKENFP